MIVRLWRARLRPGAEAELLERLRGVIPRLQGPEGPLDFTYGSRHEDGATHFLTVSVWPDFAALLEATAGDVSNPVYGLELDDLCETSVAESYERVPPEPDKLDLADGRVLGLVWGRVKPNHEGIAQSMIDRSAAAALGAGALRAHLGRRLSASAMEVLVVVVWPQRETMARFVRSRDVPAIDPAFAAHLSEWRFETYNALAPDRLLVPPDGPAVLVVDSEGRCVDATPGIENVLGIPAEMLYGRSIQDLGIDPSAHPDEVRRYETDGIAAGLIDLLRPDGTTVRVRYRSVANVPGPGLHATVLERPDEGLDPRPVDVIAAEALDLATDVGPPIEGNGMAIAPARA
jgi:PAS domain-containing protein